MLLIRLLRNLLALVGLAAVIAAGMLYPQLKKFQAEFDPGAFNTYKELAGNVLEAGNAVEATTWKVKVEEGVSIDDVIQSMKIAANDHNIKNVGELPLYKEVEAMTDAPYRHAQIFMFKAIEGPTSGIVAGKKQYIDWVKVQLHGIGRSMKVGKEASFGLLQAIDDYFDKNPSLSLMT